MFREVYKFQSTLPLRGATRLVSGPVKNTIYFNPRSPYGERRAPAVPVARPTCNFNPRSPYGERRYSPSQWRPFKGFQSTLPLRGATAKFLRGFDQGQISIHAPLTGSDTEVVVIPVPRINFNPRSPYGERHLHFFYDVIPVYFNPRSPYGERPSIFDLTHPIPRFQSTLPLRGATKVVFWARGHADISIHAPLTGSDAARKPASFKMSHFNPRSPYGERPSLPIFPWEEKRFQSTLPLRGATSFLQPFPSSGLFQSTLPLRGATWIRSDRPDLMDISIHAPLTGSDV